MVGRDAPGPQRGDGPRSYRRLPGRRRRAGRPPAGPGDGDRRARSCLPGGHPFPRLLVRAPEGPDQHLHGGDGMFLDRFVTKGETGLLLLHGCGNVFQRTLAAGETILVEPGAFLYKDSSVNLETSHQKVRTGAVQPRPLPGRAAWSGPGRHPDHVRAPRRRLTRRGAPGAPAPTPEGTRRRRSRRGGDPDRGCRRPLHRHPSRPASAPPTN